MDIGPPDAGKRGTAATSRLGGASVRRRAGRALLLLAAMALLVAAGRWLHHRFTHVLVEDARIAADMIMLSSRVPGWVTAVPVSEGQAVARGAVLAVIDDRIAGLQLREIEAQLAAAAARRAEVEARIAMIDRQTISQREAREARIAAAEAALAASEAQLELADAEYGRAQRLVDTGAGTRARLDQMRAALDAGRNQVLGRRAEIADARANLAEVVAAREQLTVLRRQLDTLAEEERGLRAQRDRAALDLADRTIVMPFDGVVSRVFADPGEYVTPGQRLLMVHDPAAVRVDANVKETDIRFFRPGTRAVVRVDAYPGMVIEGVVDRVGQAATSEFALLPNPNPSGNFTKIAQRLPVRIRVPQTEGRLRPGMLVEVEVRARE